MTPNLHEFMAMVGIVCSATFFILMLRWGIYRLGSLETQLQQKSNVTQTKNI